MNNIDNYENIYQQFLDCLNQSVYGKLYVEDVVLYFDYKGNYEYETMRQKLVIQKQIVVGGIRIDDANYIIDDFPIKIRAGELRNGYLYFDKIAFNIDYDFAIEEKSFNKLSLKRKDLIIKKARFIQNR